MSKFSSFPLGLLVSLTLAIFILPSSSSSADIVDKHKQINYHNGHILTGEVNLSILWFGKFKEQQKSHLRLFIQSLNNDKDVPLEPEVADWWRMVESYQLEVDKKLKNIPQIKINLVKETDEPTQTILRAVDFKDTVKRAVCGDTKKSIVAIVMGEDTEWEDEKEASKCYVHSITDGEQLVIVVVNPMDKLKDYCGWPFSPADKGNVGFLIRAPTEERTDLMVIHFASALAEIVTNPLGSGFSSSGEEKNQEKEEAVGIAKMCNGTFGSGSFPGYAGKVRIEPRTGESFNAHGLNMTRYLLPGLWDPKKGDCWTTM